MSMIFRSIIFGLAFIFSILVTPSAQAKSLMEIFCSFQMIAQPEGEDYGKSVGKYLLGEFEKEGYSPATDISFARVVEDGEFEKYFPPSAILTKEEEDAFFRYGTVKRGYDIVIGFTMLALAAPVILTTAALIKLSSRGPVLFIQNRYGKDGRPFRIYKFRTMQVGSDENKTLTSEGDGRLLRLKLPNGKFFPLGKKLRAGHIDELPNLLNVLKGEMAIVGPRPNPDYVDEEAMKLNAAYGFRFVAKPGITSWGQLRPYVVKPEERFLRFQAEIQQIKSGSSLFEDLRTTLWSFLKTVQGHGTR
jgi:lipopolysaccharide/colanic/teichoic acid biosynthesis glycosyltransferase